MSRITKSGVVFDIQRFSVGDGPGVRTTVFLKGCDLRCRWCHNPESHRVCAELQYQPMLCIGCGACIRACPSHAHRTADGTHALDRDRCVRCGRCAQVCLSGALRMLGKPMSAQAVMEEVVRDREIYRFSGGGMTVSGGEPMLQMDFLEELLLAAKDEDIHSAVETAGCVAYRNFEQLGDLPDLYLFDLKGMDDEQHERNTGVSNRLILENLRRLTQWKRVIVRMPLIAGLNDDVRQIRMAADFLSSLRLEQIELLPYHRFGESKYPTLGMPARTFEAPPAQRLRMLQSILEDTGNRVIVRGT